LNLTLTNQGFYYQAGYGNAMKGLIKLPTPQGNTQFEYPTRRGMVKLYGGKVIENICQAVARCVIAEQMIKISQRYRVVLTVHDAVACIAREEEKEEALAIRYWSACVGDLTWAETLPLKL